MKIQKIFIIIFLVCCSTYLRADQVFDITGEAEDEVVDDLFNIQEETSRHSYKGKIIIMNKITANSKEFLIQPGSTINFANAQITLHRCARTELGESLILVSLTQRSIDSFDYSDKRLIFKGWIFENNPSLSSPEHPVYQLMALSCS